MVTIELAQDKMNKTIAVLNRDLGTLRAGRANPKLLDRIMVDYYGTPTPINQMGTISSPEPRLLVISLSARSRPDPRTRRRSACRAVCISGSRASGQLSRYNFF